MSDTAGTLLLVNGSAGGGRARKVWRSIEGEMRGVDHMVIDATSPPTARSRLDAWLDARGSQGSRLISVGGDGTAHVAINAVLAAGRGGDVSFGVVPAGTGSDFARGLGLPRSPRRALRRALADRPARLIDAIVVETGEAAGSTSTRYCLNIASAGLSGAVDLAVNARSEHGSYLLATLGALLRYRPRACRVLVDGEPLIDGPFFVVAMANGRYFGKGMKIAPGAVVDDGKLEVVLIEPFAPWQLPWRTPQIFLGTHLRWPSVTRLAATQVRIEPPEDFFPYDLDGETLAAQPATFRIMPGAVRLLGSN